MPEKSITNLLVPAAAKLREETQPLRFTGSVVHVYHPLQYAWKPHVAYLGRYGASPKRVVFLGVNPGPFGMMQTGVPFGEVCAVRDWMKIEEPVDKPRREHPRRPIEGFAVTRSEISGRRLWGLFASRYPSAPDFFADHLVLNYCPLAFLESSGRNRTPDKLPTSETVALYTACDRHLRAVVEILKPEWVIGVGRFAGVRIKRLFDGGGPKNEFILHPSPANPAANRDWAKTVTQRLMAWGIW